MFTLGCLATYCCHQLLNAYMDVADGMAMSYAQVVYAVFWRCGGRVRGMAQYAKNTINFFLVLTQLGNCCIYLIFVARMAKEVVDSTWPESSSMDLRSYAAIVFALLIPYCFITTLKVLSYFNIYGNLATLVTLIITLQYALQNLQPIENVDLVAPNPATIPLFFGTAMFAFECIALILPIENRMTNRRAFHGWDGLFTFSMTVVLVAYLFVGFYGYLAFGRESRMILSNLPSDDWLYKSVKILYGSAIFFSYNLQLYVPISIVYPPLRFWVDKPWFDKYGEYLFRTALVILTFSLSVTIPCLELMISLFGAMAGGSLSLIFPPIVQIITMNYPGAKFSYFTLVKCIIIALFGFSGAVLGTVLTFQSIVKALGSPNGC